MDKTQHDTAKLYTTSTHVYGQELENSCVVPCAVASKSSHLYLTFIGWISGG